MIQLTLRSTTHLLGNKTNVPHQIGDGLRLLLQVTGVEVFQPTIRFAASPSQERRPVRSLRGGCAIASYGSSADARILRTSQDTPATRCSVGHFAATHRYVRTVDRQADVLREEHQRFLHALPLLGNPQVTAPTRASVRSPTRHPRAPIGRWGGLRPAGARKPPIRGSGSRPRSRSRPQRITIHQQDEDAAHRRRPRAPSRHYQHRPRPPSQITSSDRETPTRTHDPPTRQQAPPAPDFPATEADRGPAHPLCRTGGINNAFRYAL
jgi:hypothetical protein